VVIVKASQVGGSVYAILRALHACLSGLNVIYFFPTRTDVIEFSKSRVGPLIAGNPFLAKMVRDTDTAGLKKIGEAHLLHLRGMQSSVQMKSVPADMLIFDELDEASPDAKAMAKERLAHSDYKRIIELSNPSLPDYGIDEPYRESDQRHWMNKCPGCGYWVSLAEEFPKKLGEEVKIILPRGDGSFYRACPKCSAELDIEVGEWVPMEPDNHAHGSHCGENLPLESSDHCTMGVDTGRQMHVVISKKIKNTKKREVVYLRAHNSFEELDDLMKRFGVQVCVIDGMPETHATRAFARRHHGHVFLCFFNDHQRGADKWDTKELTVQVNRTEALDYSRRMIREGRRVLPRRSRQVEEFARHLCADAKQLHEDEATGAQSYRYLKTGENHYSLAFTYDTLAAARQKLCEGPYVEFLTCEWDGRWIPMDQYALTIRRW